MTREEARKHLEFLKIMDAPKLREAVDMAIEALQERPKERWVFGSELDDVDYEHFLYCSNCHGEAYWDTDYGQQTFDFCPNCGADMRESEQE